MSAAVGGAAVRAVNPVAKIAAAGLLALCLVLTIDPVSAGVALAIELALFTALGIPWRVFWRRTLPVWIAAPLTALTIALYGRASGAVHLEFWFVRVTDGSLEFALATLLRVLAVALPAVVLFITIDPTDLADGLAQVWRLPARFVLGALAGVRLIGLSLEDWRLISLARRARGVADRGALCRLPGQAFALFVLAIRRGGTLSTAMEGRGFGADGRTRQRTWARESTWGGRESVTVLLGAVVGAAGVTAAILAGTWTPIIG